MELLDNLIIMKNRKQNELAYQIVNTVISEWDPYGLLVNGAPEDEFEWEVSLLVAQISNIHTEKDAIKAISKIFTQAFEPGLFNEASCAEVGSLLFKRLVENNLLN